MDRKIIIMLLVSSVVIGCLSVQVNVAGGDQSFYPGFLLYLPGKLWAGSTATAYIETNFTDPFEARLSFLHSYEDRQFYVEARIVNGSGVIEFEVPDVNYWSGRIEFTGIMEDSRQMFTSLESTSIYIIQQSQKVTFIETDKPLYKPGQEVKFRLLTIDSQFKPETSNIPKIQIESPSQIRLAQWRDVERPEGLIDLSFQLISEPVLGDYKIKAYINDAWVTQTFKVEEYVLPKVEVTMNVPSYVLITAQEYSFQVCAKYTNGQPVRGSVSGDVSKLHNTHFYYDFRRRNPVLVPFGGQLDTQGCLESSVSGLELASYDTPYFIHTIAVRANVVEDTTGDVFVEITDETQIEIVPINIALKSADSFKPGIPYQGIIKVTYPDGKPAPNEAINITVTAGRKNAYTADHISNSEGIVEFEIPHTVVDKLISLQVMAKGYPYQHNPHGYSIESPSRRFILNPNYSPSGRYLQIKPIFDPLNAGYKVTFQVLYTSDDGAVSSDFKVQFFSRNKLVNAEATQEADSRRRGAVMLDNISSTPRPNFVTLETFILPARTQEPIVHVGPQTLHEVNITVPITAGISPEAKLLVYYTSPEGEVVADSINLKINKAFENKVKLEFFDPEVSPGSETTLKVSAENASLCGIGIVDKSVYVLGGENKVTPNRVFSAFDLSVQSIRDSRSCPHNSNYRFIYDSEITFPGFDRLVNYVDSSSAFTNSGLKALTNYDLWVAPCVFDPQIVDYLFDVDSDFPRRSGKAKGNKIRSFFPETWLWSLTRVSGGEVEMPLTVPHSITDWIANGLCTNVEKGLGVSPPVVLRAFQHFFLSMSLPYSIIRTEKTPIKVTVFNYLEQCLVVRVTLEENEGFALSGPNEYTVVVPSGEATTVTFKVVAVVLGSIPLQVSAESISDDGFLCGNETVAEPAGSSDAVRRDLKVKPEGEPETTTESAYFCLKENETYSEQISLKIPPQHVHGTAVGEIYVTGDIVGNTLSNVESMLRMPYGCGEQNLVSMVPNIVALQYLESVGEATPEITAEAKKYILSGYQRELNYRRSDNSYAAFGESNPSGSTFLTAFVVKTYAHAQMFVDIDEQDLYLTIQWLRGIQNVDGSFRTVGHLAHKAMKGGVNNDVTLAAYMVATFLEAGYDSQDETVAAAIAYIDSRLDTLEDTYSMALLAYAYALAGSDRFDVVYEMLQDLAVESEGMRHWESNREDLPAYTTYYQDSSKAQNIEMTAYVLRAMVSKQVPSLEVEGGVIARWLVSQRNPRGGFISTQDTVIGLTALAEFAALGTGENSDLTLTMNIRGEPTLRFHVHHDNRFIVQRDSFDSFPVEINVNGTGRGCALYSISGDYYIKSEKQKLDPFTLDVKAKVQNPKPRKRRDAYGGGEHEYLEKEEATCDKFTITVSARYNGEDGASNMAIINFRPVSGFVFEKRSLEAMLRKYKFVKRYEINGDIITFYFDELTNEDVDFEFNVTKDFDVEDAKPAFMSILDYYENGLKVTEEFGFACVDDVPTSSPSTTYPTPPSPSGFASSSSMVTPEEPSCPFCNGVELPLGVDDLICASDLILVMKVRSDGSLRSLYDLVNQVNIQGRIYYDVEVNEACTCDLIASGVRIIVVASSDHISSSTGSRDGRVLLDEDVVIVSSSIKKDIVKILDRC